jgi:hypothetical protein
MLRPCMFLGFLALLPGSALAQGVTTDRVIVATGGAEANAGSGPGILGMSDDGRCVAFYSDATNVVPGDANGFRDAFVHDRLIATTELVSVSSTGDHGNAGSGNAASWFDIAGIAMSRDGRYVAFCSDASNLPLELEVVALAGLLARPARRRASSARKCSSFASRPPGCCFFNTRLPGSAPWQGTIRGSPGASAS